MTHTPPLVSIMIPTCNRAPRLVRAVESALNQGYSRIEIIVSDNASEDGTDSYLKSISHKGVRTYRHERNVGLIANWNFLLAKATGEYCLMLSDDDELLCQAIEGLVGCMSRDNFNVNGKIDAVIGKSSSIKNASQRARNSTLVLTGRELMKRVLRGELQVLPSATLLRTEAVKDRGYRAYYGTAIDLGLLADLPNGSNVAIIDQDVCNYNVHADNVTSKFDVDEVYKTYRRLVKAAYGGMAGGIRNRDESRILIGQIVGYVVAERYASSRISLLSAFRYMKRYYRYFQLYGCALIFVRMVVKRCITAAASLRSVLWRGSGAPRV